jgi:hypothetical protein
MEKARKDIIQWIQTLDDEELIYELYEFKERNREITPEEKQEYNRWLAALDYAPQLEMLRSIIASSPDRDAILSELSPAAQENIRVDEEVRITDLRDTLEQFWELVSNLKKGDELNREGLSEVEKEIIEQRLVEADAGQTIPHEEVMEELNQWLNDMTLKRIKEDIPDLPEEMRGEIADFVLKTLNRSDPEIERAIQKAKEQL